MPSYVVSRDGDRGSDNQSDSGTSTRKRSYYEYASETNAAKKKTISGEDYRPRYGQNPFKKLKTRHPLLGEKEEAPVHIYDDTDYNDSNNYEDGGRILYNTTKLVHEPVYAFANKCEIGALKEVKNYDDLKESMKRYATEKSKETLSGDEKMKRLRYYLDNLGLKRHFLQVKFHEQMILACLSKIYEDEWETQYEQIMKRYGVTRMKRELIFSCPRRFGKTYSVGLFAAAYMLAIPNCQEAIFSTGKRTAKKLMVLILHFLTFYPGINDPGRIVTKNQEDLVLEFAPDDHRCLSCYPSSVKEREEDEWGMLTSSVCQGVEKTHKQLLGRSNRDYVSHEHVLRKVTRTPDTNVERGKYGETLDPIEAHRVIGSLLKGGTFADLTSTVGLNEYATAQTKLYELKEERRPTLDEALNGSTPGGQEEGEDDDCCKGYLLLDPGDPLLCSPGGSRRPGGKLVKTLHCDSDTTFYESLACYCQIPPASTATDEKEDEEGVERGADSFSSNYASRHWTESDKKKRVYVVGVSLLDYVSRITFSVPISELAHGLETLHADGALHRWNALMFKFLSNMSPNEMVRLGSSEYNARLTFLFRLYDVFGIKKPERSDAFEPEHLKILHTFLLHEYYKVVEAYCPGLSSAVGLDVWRRWRTGCPGSIFEMRQYSLSYILEPIFCSLFRTAAITYAYDGEANELVKCRAYVNTVIADEVQIYFYGLMVGDVHECLMWSKSDPKSLVPNIIVLQPDAPMTSPLSTSSYGTSKLGRPSNRKRRQRNGYYYHPQQQTPSDGNSTATTTTTTTEDVDVVYEVTPVEKLDGKPLRETILSSMNYNVLTTLRNRTEDLDTLSRPSSDDGIVNFYHSIPPDFVSVAWMGGDLGVFGKRPSHDAGAQPEIIVRKKSNYAFLHARRIPEISIPEVSSTPFVPPAAAPVGVSTDVSHEKSIRSLFGGSIHLVKDLDRRLGYEGRRRFTKCLRKLRAHVYELDLSLYDFNACYAPHLGSRTRDTVCDASTEAYPSPTEILMGMVEPFLTVFPTGACLLNRNVVFSVFSSDPEVKGPLDCLCYDNDFGIGKIDVGTKNRISFPILPSSTLQRPPNVRSKSSTWSKSRLYLCWFSINDKEDESRSIAYERFMFSKVEDALFGAGSSSSNRRSNGA